MTVTNLPHTIESMLDLFPPHVITQSLEYLVGLDEDPVEDWEPRHINAAEQLCNYMQTTHPRVAEVLREKLLLKLQLIEEE